MVAERIVRNGSQRTIRDKLHEFKREQILESAGRLFIDRGYRATTMDAIAKDLSVTKPFIYYHFKNKADILQTLLERTTREAVSLFDGLEAHRGSQADALKELVRRLACNVIENQALVALFWRNEKDLPIRDRKVIRQLKREFDERLTRIIDRGVKSAEFDAIDSKLASLAIAGMVTWIYTWYTKNGRLGYEEVAEHYARLALNMVRRHDS